MLASDTSGQASPIFRRSKEFRNILNCGGFPDSFASRHITEEPNEKIGLERGDVSALYVYVCCMSLIITSIMMIFLLTVPKKN